MNRWMPESHASYDVFLGECCWSPGYREHFTATMALNRGQREIPVQYGDELQYQEFTLTIPTAAKCGPVFADLASRAGAALSPAIRSQLADFVPMYVSQMAPWWFAFLWRVFVGTDPLRQPISAATGKPVEMPGPPLPLLRPFLLSVDAIELCEPHTDQPVFPPPATKSGHDDKTAGKSKEKESENRGRPVVTDPKKDQQILDAWGTGSYPKYEDLARELHVTTITIKHAIDRHKKRIAKQSDTSE